MRKQTEPQMCVLLWCYFCEQSGSVCQGLLEEIAKKKPPKTNNKTLRIVSLGAEEAGMFSNTLPALFEGHPGSPRHFWLPPCTT